MRIEKISQFLGTKVNSYNKKEAQEIVSNLILKILQLHRQQSFGVLTLHNSKQNSFHTYRDQIIKVENFLKYSGFNFIKFSALWNLKFKEVMTFREIGFIILNVTFERMKEISSRVDQDLFILSKVGDTNVYYSDGSQIHLENDTYEFGKLNGTTVILNFVDFKMFIDEILDFHFHFIARKDLQIDDRIMVFAKNKFTFQTHLEIIDIYDIRQNGIISIERSNRTPAITPKIFHFDEIVWAIKINSPTVSAKWRAYKDAV